MLSLAPLIEVHTAVDTILGKLPSFKRASRSLAKTGFFEGSKSMAGAVFWRHLGEIRISGAGFDFTSVLGWLWGAFWELFGELLGHLGTRWAPFGGPFGLPLGPLGACWVSFPALFTTFRCLRSFWSAFVSICVSIGCL